MILRYIWRVCPTVPSLSILVSMIAALAIPSVGSGTTVVLSDSFSRNPPGVHLGTPPLRDTSNPNPPGWVSNWGANNNFSGGYVTQTYTTYKDTAGNQYKTDGTNGISGNWLNNGSSSYPLKLANAATTITEPIGIPGFAWVQINHDFAADALVASSPFLRINFDLYRTPGGNISWFFGQDDATGVSNGNAGSPATIAANDISLYWRGFQSATFGLRDNGAVPGAVPGISNYDSIAYASGTNVTTLPIPIQIEILGTNFSSGQSSTVELTVAGVAQDLNGTAPGTGYTFVWDGGGKAYMGFGSNNTPVEGTVANPVYRASGIDNLVITVIPEPGCLSWLTSLVGGLVLCRRRR